MLPGTDGFTICRAVRERKDIPIGELTFRLGGRVLEKAATLRRERSVL